MNTKNIFKTFFLCLSVISLSFTLNAQELKPLRLGVGECHTDISMKC